MIHRLGTIIKNHDQYKYIIQKKKNTYIYTCANASSVLLVLDFCCFGFV